MQLGVLQITSNVPHGGKTSLAAALLLAMSQGGSPGGYYKPFSEQPDNDADIALMQAALRQAQDERRPSEAPEIPASLGSPPDSEMGATQSQQLRETVSGLLSSGENILLDGPGLESGASLVNQVSSETGSRVLLLFCPVGPVDTNEIVQAATSLGDSLAGVIVNCVPRHRLSEVRQALTADLAAQNIPLLGVVPELRIMRAPTVQQLARTLQGRWVQEPDDGSVLVERLLIGGNIMDAGPEYYGRYSSQAVITRCQRTDIQLASMMPGTKCLVLTGGGEPAEYIKAEAMQRRIPIMVVESDTPDTAQALAPLLDSPSPLTIPRLQAFAHHLQGATDPEQLLALVG